MIIFFDFFLIFFGGRGNGAGMVIIRCRLLEGKDKVAFFMLLTDNSRQSMVNSRQTIVNGQQSMVEGLDMPDILDCVAIPGFFSVGRPTGRTSRTSLLFSHKKHKYSQI